MPTRIKYQSSSCTSNSETTDRFSQLGDYVSVNNSMQPSANESRNMVIKNSFYSCFQIFKIFLALNFIMLEITKKI